MQKHDCECKVNMCTPTKINLHNQIRSSRIQTHTHKFKLTRHRPEFNYTFSLRLVRLLFLIFPVHSKLFNRSRDCEHWDKFIASKFIRLAYTKKFKFYKFSSEHRKRLSHRASCFVPLVGSILQLPPLSVTAVYNKFPQIFPLSSMLGLIIPLKHLTAHFKWKLKLWREVLRQIVCRSLYCFMNSVVITWKPSASSSTAFSFAPKVVRVNRAINF